jgi:hypothetical protein
VTLRAHTIVAILTACAPAVPPRPAHRAGPSPLPAPIPAAVLPAPATAAAAPASQAWERWPVWAYLEAGSAALRARLESAWGGITRLSHGQLPLLADVTGMSEAFTVTFAAIQDRIDAARPMRQLTSRGDVGRVAWAIAFAAGATSRDQLPTICRSDPAGPFHAVEVPSPGEWCAPCEAIDRPGDRAIVCGMGDAAAALRADFVARGLSGTTDVVHAEQHLDWTAAPSRVVLEVHDAAGALHATIRATPRIPPTGQVSQAALAAASRIQVRSPRVDVGGPFPAYDMDLMTPLGFDGFDAVVPTQGGPYHAWTDDKGLIFLEMTVDKLATRMAAYWRTFNSDRMLTRVDALPAPASAPAGTRRFRRREWSRDDGAILRCSPQQRAMGGCMVVGHRPPTTSAVRDVDYLLIPGDGGTWIATAGVHEQVTAVLEVITSTATPPTWTLPAVALGKQSTAQAELFWAEHVRADGDLDFEIDGAIKP